MNGNLSNTWRTVLLLGLALCVTTPSLAGPYSPAATQPGSDAISYTDPRIVEWASGYLNYAQGTTTEPNYFTSSGKTYPGTPLDS